MSAAPGTAGTNTITIDTVVNGNPWRGEVAAGQTLLEFLRTRLRLTGTKWSCESEVCGACTVLLDDAAVSACSVLAFEVDGHEVTTIENLAAEDDDQLNALQQAFLATGAVQCGYCTPGQLMAATALLREDPHPSMAEIRAWMTGNICRCGCYTAIASAIEKVAQKEGDTDGR